MSSGFVMISVDQVSTRLTSRLSVSRDLDSFARGLLTTYNPKNKIEYDQFRRYLHDILCLGLVDQGYFRNEELTLSKLSIRSDDHRMNNCKPDLYTIEENEIRVCDVGFSHLPDKLRREKLEKYNEFFALIEKARSVRVNYKPLIIDLTDSEYESQIPPMNSLYASMIHRFVENLRFIHSSSRGYQFREAEKPYNIELFNFQADDEHLSDVINHICKTDKLSFQQFKSETNLEDLDESKYMNSIATSIVYGKYHSRPCPRPGKTIPQSLLQEWNEFKLREPTTEKLPVILQLGCPSMTNEIAKTFDEVVTDLKDTKSFGGYLDLIKQSLANSDPSSSRTIQLVLNSSQRDVENSQGPGKKDFLKRKGIFVKRKQPTHIGIDTQHSALLQDFIGRIDRDDPYDYLREIDNPPLESCGQSMMNNINRLVVMHYKSGTSLMLRFYQSISQEIILNSMRRRKRREYVLGYSGFNGVYFLIAPGAQLRTESNTVFVKIISLCVPVTHQLSREWLSTGDHWESDWISVDTDRLKHWSRAFDRCFLSNCGSAERLVEPGLNMTEAAREEISAGNYCLMALTYLENKQLTSSTNQTIRYLWMKNLGDKSYKGLLSKFPSRVSSVIQSHMLQRSIKVSIDMSQTNLSDYLSVNQLIREEEFNSLDETTTGVVGKLPRLFTFGNMVPISYNLNEIYWCMMYNKDRQNPSQDAMKILTKIVKEELKFTEEMSSRETEESRLKYFTGTSSVQDDIRHIHSDKPESHYYSSAAVTIGIREQDKHSENTCPNSMWLTNEKLSSILSRDLSEYATFKASVKTIEDHIDITEADEIKKIGKRTKCIELVYQLVNDEGLKNAMEVAKSFSGVANHDFKLFIQIFKKNQVGGVREILILFIKARILINILEEICRLLSKADRREILTKGKDKRLMMRGDYEELSSSFPKGTPLQFVKNSYDMSTWCQKFIPTIFMPIYEHHFINNKPIRDFAHFMLIKHSNKEIEYPKKLVEQWMLHPEMVHTEPSLEIHKRNFLRTGTPKFYNHSNMGQGILHYNSTVLALSCQSFRDRLFSTCLGLLNQQPSIKWKTRVGSDDKGEIIALDLSEPNSRPQYILFEQCSRAAERLHAMDLSVKSASGNIIYELNSAFMSNLESLSPIIKFTMAACDLIGTSSCTNYVNESYSRIRQIRENGGSSLLCGLAHILNDDHFRIIFRTGDGMINNPRSIFNCNQDKIPYDLGVYPFYDIDIQDMIGPEYHNYLIYTSDRTDVNLLKLLYTELSQNKEEEMLPTEDTPLFKKDHFGISQGLVRQLNNMRSRLGVTAESVLSYLQTNPFMIVRGPQTLTETKMLIASKLYTKGASEALRRTSPAIYIGRLSAFESAKAWNLVQESVEETLDLETNEYKEEKSTTLLTGLTFAEFLRKGLEHSSKSEFNKEENLHLIFPQHQSYEVVRQFTGQFGIRHENKKRYSQTVRTWTLNNYNYNFTNSLRTILETSFGYTTTSSLDDVHELRKLVNVDLSSYDSLIEDCNSKGIRPLDLFFYLSKIYKSLKTTKPQVFASGPSTTSLNMTLQNIKKYNHLPNSVMMIGDHMDEELTYHENTLDKQMDMLKLCFNLDVMYNQGFITGQDPLHNIIYKGNTLHSTCSTLIRGIRSISGFDQQTKKIMIYLSSTLLDPSELKERLLAWKTLNYTYIKTQKKIFDDKGRTTWAGDLEVLVNSGPDSFTLNVKGGHHYIRCLRVEDLDSLYVNLNELCKMLNLDFRSFFQLKTSKIDDIYLKGKRLFQCQVVNSQINSLKIQIDRNYQFKRLREFVNFEVKKERKKDGSIVIYLKDKSSRSANLSHFPGHYYPVPIPIGLSISESLKVNGITMCKLFENNDWFFNGRLPSMTQKETINFLREQVDFNSLMSAQTDEKVRMSDYMAMHEEVNEENFALSNINEAHNRSYIKPKVIDFDLENRTMVDIFNDAMDELADWGAPIDNWADDFDQTDENDEEDLFNISTLTERMKDERTIEFTRALGQRKPTKKKNFFSITNLQQSSLMKTRILDCFFTMNSILSEDRSNLPYYCLWLKHLNTDRDDLRDNLLNHIKSYICYTTGVTNSRIESLLSNASPSLARPIIKLQLFLNWQEKTLMELIMGINKDKQELEDSDVEDY